jgi:CTP synthase (UTP-ammonia lyase)
MHIIAIGDRNPRYLTHREVDAALALLPDADWVATDDPAARDLDGIDGVWLLPGTPYRDEDAAHDAIRHCLDTGTRFLGTCGGFQHACLVLAGRAKAHAETNPDDPEPLIAPLACTLYGERRTVTARPGTKLSEIVGTEPFEGYHYCGFGLSERAAADAGLTVAATAPHVGVEAIELPGHPFFLATAFQPQVGVSETGRLPALVQAFAG